LSGNEKFVEKTFITVDKMDIGRGPAANKRERVKEFVNSIIEDEVSWDHMQ